MRGGFSKNFNNFSDSPFEESNVNALKYSKEYMLSLYKPSQLPSDFQHHEYVTVEESLTPLAFDELSELEKKVSFIVVVVNNLPETIASFWSCSC